MNRNRSVVIVSILVGVLALSPTGASAADSSAITSAFSRLVTNKDMANPSVIVVDEITGEVVYQANAYAPRKPASVIKLLSAMAAFTYLSPSDSFTTSLWSGVDTKSVVIQGSLDPWISFDDKLAQKQQRTSLPRIEYNALGRLKNANAGSTEGTTIYVSNLNPQEVRHIEAFLKERKASTKVVRTYPKFAQAKSANILLSSTSPTLDVIVDWALTWSDNLVSERVARLASVAAGNPLNSEGAALTFKAMLTDMGLSTKNLVIKDASGLSHDNRITAKLVADLLMILYHNPKFSPLIEGFPVGGLTGTLQERFIETAPQAIGLVRAKTGTLNGTTNLAGYVESGDRQYIFVIIADRHNRSYTITKRVRAFVDRVLGRIAIPKLPDLLPITPVDTTTVTTEN